jgi:polyisoprenoid-binding protein YceI
MTRRFKSLLLVGSFATLVPVLASAKLSDAGDVEVTFEAAATGLTINGWSKRLTVSETDGKIKVTVPASSVKTGIGLRDKHLKGFIEAEKCPDISLEIPRSKLKFPENDKQTSGEAVGDFTLHCITKPMKFKYTARRTGSDFHVDATPEKAIDIREHGVRIPKYLGVVEVNPHVKLTKIKFKAREGS